LEISNDIYLRVVTINPLKFALTCVTTGGPATQVTWAKDNWTYRFPADIGVELLQHVVDYENATYVNEIVISSSKIAGRYDFYSLNAVTREVSSTIDLSGKKDTLVVYKHYIILCRSSAAATQWKHSV
jgi:hypothetical protein